MTGYSGVIRAPFGYLGIKCTKEYIYGIDFLLSERECEPVPDHYSILDELSAQLVTYFTQPNQAVFNLPYRLEGTPFQQQVWQKIAQIPCAQTQFYSDISLALHSSPRAVGGACARNPLPLIIPCHRVVGQQGLGGFNGAKAQLEIKKWLLQHEARNA